MISELQLEASFLNCYELAVLKLPSVYFMIKQKIKYECNVNGFLRIKEIWKYS